IDRPRARDDAVAGDLLGLHPEVGAIVFDEHVIFFEAALIEQHGKPLPRCQASLGMLRRNALFPATEPCPFAALLELFDGCRQALISSPVRLPRRTLSVNQRAAKLR